MKHRSFRAGRPSKTTTSSGQGPAAGRSQLKSPGTRISGALRWHCGGSRVTLGPGEARPRVTGGPPQCHLPCPTNSGTFSWVPSVCRHRPRPAPCPGYTRDAGTPRIRGIRGPCVFFTRALGSPGSRESPGSRFTLGPGFSWDNPGFGFIGVPAFSAYAGALVDACQKYFRCLSPDSGAGFERFWWTEGGRG